MNTPTTPLVLLHGVGLDHTMWEPLTTTLTATGQNCITLDLPGHGTEPPLRTPHTLAQLSNKVLAHLPPEPVHLLGFSLGALIAQHIARYSPARIKTLICVNSVCRRTPEESKKVEARLHTAGQDFRGGVEASIERWYPAKTTTVPKTIIEHTRTVLLNNDIESYLHAYTVFARGDQEISPELTHILTPTLAITGELDPGSPPEMSYRLAAAIPHCHTHIVPRTHHMLPVENTAALAAAVTAFITASEGATRD